MSTDAEHGLRVEIARLQSTLAAANARADAAEADAKHSRLVLATCSREERAHRDALAAARRECEALISSVMYLRLIGTQMATFIEEQMPLFGGASSEFDGEGEPREILKRWRQADKIADKSYGTAFAAPAPDPRKECGDNSPEWWTGRWQDWHRSHGCSKDDGKPCTPDGIAEFVAHGRLPGRASPATTQGAVARYVVPAPRLATAEKRIAELEASLKKAHEYCLYMFTREWLTDPRNRSIFAAHIFGIIESVMGRQSAAPGEKG